MGSDVLHPENMRYCPGCGQRSINTLLAEVIEDMGLAGRVITVAPAGCGAYIGEIIQTASLFAPHGRGVSVATGLKNADPGAIVIAYQGDGDFSGIGLADSLHGIRRNENITLIHVNNGCYGMTGGQVAPTSTLGYVSPTTKTGSPYTPLDMCVLASAINKHCFIYRGILQKRKTLGDALRRSLERQQNRSGFSFIEVLSPCPTAWKGRKQLQEMISRFQTGIISEGDASGRGEEERTYSPREIFEALKKDFPDEERKKAEEGFHQEIIVSGRGGQGIQTLGAMIAGASYRAGYEVAVLPAYGAEKKGGKSECGITISSRAITSPKIERPTVVVLMNTDPGLEERIVSGGTLIYDPDFHTPERDDIRVVKIPAQRKSCRTGEKANTVLFNALRSLAGF